MIRHFLSPLAAILTLAIPVGASSQTQAPQEAYVTGSSELVSASHASDGTGRARDGKLRFVGPLGAQATSFNGYQYVVYYTGRDRSIAREEAFSQVVVARRKLGGFAWEHSTLQNYRITSDDLHNRQTIGISNGDGVIHIAFDHHNERQMNYAATAPGVANAPDTVTWDDTVFTYAKNLGGDPDERLDVTYPAFNAFPGGNLVVYFRSGGAYGGEMRVARYDAATGKWGKVHAVSSRHGTYQGLKTTRGPYLGDGVQVGADGSLHAAWVFREKPCDYTTSSRDESFCNHGLYYARSNDEGQTWLRADGSQVADTALGEAISIDNIGPPVIEVPKGQGPSNASITSTVDPASGDVHVLLQHMPKPGADKRFYYHYVGSPDGTWQRTQTDFSGTNTTLSMQGDRLYAFTGRRNGQIFFAEREDGFSKWQNLPIRIADKRFLNARGGFINWDISRLADGHVSMIWHRQPDKIGESSPVVVVDIALEGT